MKIVLEAKHWQVFLYLMLGVFFIYFSVEGEPLLTTIIQLVGFLMIYAWPLVLGMELYNYLPKRIDLNYTLFIINGFISLGTFSALIIIGQSISGNGLAALPILYFFYAFFHLLMFPGRVLKSIELNKRADFSDYFGNFFLIFFYPIGVWIIQPRVNKIVNENVDINDQQ